MRIRWRGFELPTRVTCEEETLTPTYGKFVAEPFMRGFGITVGNSLRRVLLSSLEGAAPTSLRIKGIRHEFDALQGMFEDVTDVVLNLKQLLVKMEDNRPITLKISKKGKGPVTAKDIEPHHQIEVINPELVLATLTEDILFEAEITVAKGRGLVLAEEHNIKDQPVGTIAVDSIFTPVRRVRYHNENTRVGQLTNFDKLILEIWTDGTVAPKMALIEASTILRKHFNPFIKQTDLAEEVEKEDSTPEDVGAAPSGPDAELAAKIAKPITELEPSVRAYNCLKAEGIKTIGDLVARNESDMLKIRNFGKTSMKELKKKLEQFGLSFGMKIDRKE